MSDTRRQRGLSPAGRRRAYRSGPQQGPQGRPGYKFTRAACCGALTATDPGAMGPRWADVHRAGCAEPWRLLELDGEPFEVYPGADGVPPGLRLRAVNRRDGSLVSAVRL